MQSHENVIQTRHGHFLLDTTTDAKMAGRLVGNIFPQQDLLELIQALGTRKVIDVGAHVGTVSIPAAELGKEVIAFEPNLQSFGYLKHNIELNKSRVDMRNKGLAEKKGRAKILITQNSNAGAHSLVAGDEVEVSTLDLEIPQADFIKIDVEGMELSVLKGGTKLIEQSHPAIYFEVNISALRDHGTSLCQLSRFFLSRNYRLYFLENRILYRLPGLSFAALYIAPRSFLFESPSAPFDVLALPAEVRPPYPSGRYIRTSVYLFTRYVKLQYARFFN